MDRELGTATQPCPTCGTALAVVELQEGVTSTVRCDTCYPVTLVEIAAQELPRETGTPADDEPGDDDD